jgi:hypothetical protein
MIVDEMSEMSIWLSRKFEADFERLFTALQPHFRNSQGHYLLGPAKAVVRDERRFAAPVHHDFPLGRAGEPTLELSWSHPTLYFGRAAVIGDLLHQQHQENRDEKYLSHSVRVRRARRQSLRPG